MEKRKQTFLKPHKILSDQCKTRPGPSVKRVKWYCEKGYFGVVKGIEMLNNVEE